MHFSVDVLVAAAATAAAFIDIRLDAIPLSFCPYSLATIRNTFSIIPKLCRTRLSHIYICIRMYKLIHLLRHEHERLGEKVVVTK